MRKILFAILLNIVLVGVCSGSDFQFYNLTVEMGLTETSVNVIFQDYEGFVWIGTKDGLFRYNGHEFKKYSKSTKDFNSLWNSDVTIVFEDEDHVLWVGTARGLNKYNRNLDRFERVPLVFNNEYFRNNIYRICEVKNTLWLATDYGVFSYNKKNSLLNKQLENVAGLDSLFMCREMKFDKEGFLWCAVFDNKNGGLLKYNINLQQTELYLGSNNSLQISANNITTFAFDSDNTLWIGYSDSGIEKVNFKNGEVINYSSGENIENTLTSNFVHSIIQDHEGSVFIGTDNGLNFYNESTDDFTRIWANSSNGSILSNIVFGIPHCSSDNTLWFPCKGGGVSVLDKSINKFEHYNFVPGKNSLSHNHVLSFTEDIKGNIYIASDGGGINVFNTSTKKFKSFTHSVKEPNLLTNNKVLAVLVDENNGLWAGMWQGGISYYNIEDGNLKLQKKIRAFEDQSESYSSVFKMFKARNNHIWFGTFGEGAYKLDALSGQFEHYPIKINGELPGVYSVCEDSKGNVWLGTTGSGLIHLNTVTQKVTHYPYIENDSISIPASTIYAIHEDSKKRIWFGTRGGGLAYYIPEIDGFGSITSDQGLASDKIVGILEDDSGNLWLSSNNGLSRVSVKNSNLPHGLSIKNFDVSDGLQSKFFNAWSYHKSKSGYMYFGGTNGFNRFHPDSLFQNYKIPKVHITDFLLFNKSVEIGGENSPLTKHVSQTSKIKLKHNQSVVTFKYVALNYVYNSKTEYAYTLEGFDPVASEWNYVGNQQMATYTNIPPGKYIFKVKATNIDGYWNESPTTVELVVIPAWWQTWVFRICAIGFVIFVVFRIYRRRVKNLNTQKKILEQKVSERTFDLQHANTELEQQKTQIQEQNAELLASEEELQQLNEELSVTNDQLFQQKDELEKTLHNLKETQSQLVQSEKMASLGILTSGIAHEINNPLNFIQGGKTTLKLYIEDNYPDLSDEFSPYIDMIDDGINRAAGIVQGLSRFNRKTDDYSEECNLHNIIDNCLLMLHYQIKYEISIEKKYNRTPLVIIGNEGEIHQVLINVLMNAVQAVSTNGRIHIKTYLKSNNVGVIEIQDNGYGISEEDIEKITAPFYTTKAPGEGTGLGMSIAYSIIKKHKGTINYESEIGKGTTVTLAFPV